jgi:hypothetical protein
VFAELQVPIVPLHAALEAATRLAS